MRRLIGAVCFLLLLPGLLWAQEGLFSSMRSGLGELDEAIASLSGNLLAQQEQLLILQQRIKDSEKELTLSGSEISGLKAISETQAAYLNLLKSQIATLEATRKEQLRYQNGLKRQLFCWKVGGVTLGLTSAGLLAWALIEHAK